MVVVLACLMLLAGCRLDLTVEAVVNADGGGLVVLTAAFDAALLAELDELGVDPTGEFEAAAAASPGWEVERHSDDRGGLHVRAQRTVEDAEQIGGVLRELTSGLADTDPALLVDVEVVTLAEGTEVTGLARFRPPATAGIHLDGAPLGPEPDELAAIVADGVATEFRLRLPGEVLEHDGDRVEDRTVVWELPAGEEIDVRAVAEPASWWATVNAWWSARDPLELVAGGAAALLGVVALGALVRRFRRSG